MYRYFSLFSKDAAAKRSTMSNPLDEPSMTTPKFSTPAPEQTTSINQPLAIEDAPGGSSRKPAGDSTDGQGDQVHALDLGGGNVVKLDKLGPMIINSDGTLSRIQNWQDLHPIEQERTVRLLVKKRNLVRLGKLGAEEQEAGNAQ